MYPVYGSYYNPYPLSDAEISDDGEIDISTPDSLVPPSSLDPNLYDNVPLSTKYGLIADYMQPLFPEDFTEPVIQAPIQQQSYTTLTTSLQKDYGPISVPSASSRQVISDTKYLLNESPVYTKSSSTYKKLEVVGEYVEVCDTEEKLRRNGFVKVDSKKVAVQLLKVHKSCDENSDEESKKEKKKKSKRKLYGSDRCKRH